MDVIVKSMPAEIIYGVWAEKLILNATLTETKKIATLKKMQIEKTAG